MRRENEKVSFACLVVQVHLVAKSTHPHWETRHATQQVIENFRPSRVIVVVVVVNIPPPTQNEYRGCYIQYLHS